MTLSIEKSLARTIPRDLAATVKWRESMLARAKISKQMQRDLKAQCKEDILFFFDAFLMTFNPRTDTKHYPFLTYTYQQHMILDLVDAICGNLETPPSDRHIDKSRDMGATWCILGVYLWLWLFHPDSIFLMVSRNEDLVDKGGNPDCLFWKVDYLLAWLPAWMRPKHARTHLNLTNLDNGSVIDGESTNGNIGRGGRRKSIFADEFSAVENGDQVLSATADTSPCRLWVGTPKGCGNAFARLKLSNKVKQISLHWSQHPDKARGLYKVKDGELTILDPAYKFPAGYNFVESGGKLRSVWYDNECARRTTREEVAQELDIDYLSSGRVFFDNSVLEAHKQKYGADPVAVGELLFTRYAVGEGYAVRLAPEEMGEKSTAFKKNAGRKRLQIWEFPDADKNYVVTVDISQGQGASNSVICVGDRHTRKKIAQWVCCDTMPQDLAVVAVALCQFYSAGNSQSAFLCWEANGPGAVFGKEAIRLGHGFYYIQRNPVALDHKESKTPGWHSSGTSKELMLSDYRTALDRDDVIIPSRDSIQEAFTYVYFNGGGIGPFSLEAQSNGARAAHGDRVIADALLVLAFREVGKFKPPAPDAPYGSFAFGKARRPQHKQNAWS